MAECPGSKKPMDYGSRGKRTVNEIRETQVQVTRSLDLEILDYDKYELVLLESPYAGSTMEEIEENLVFGRKCMRDCFVRGEMAFAGHLLYTQPGILVDERREERKLGMETSFRWAKDVGAKSVVYLNLGLTKGMIDGMLRAKKDNRRCVLRMLGEDILGCVAMDRLFVFISGRIQNSVPISRQEMDEFWYEVCEQKALLEQLDKDLMSENVQPLRVK